MKGRPSGGIACLFKKGLGCTFEVLETHPRYIVCNLKFDNKNVILINVYMPYDDGSSECIDNYLHVLALIENRLDNTKYDAIYISGDFNADPFGSRLWRFINDFSIDTNLVCYDFNILPDNTFTFMSNNNLFCRWIDHVIGTENSFFYIDKVNVMYDVVGSDHFPLEFEIRLNINDNNNPNNNVNESNKNNCSQNNKKPHVKWNKINKNTIKEISSDVIKNIADIVDSLNFYKCDEGSICHNLEHMNVIDDMYDKLVHYINVGMQDLKSLLSNDHVNSGTVFNNARVDVRTHSATQAHVPTLSNANQGTVPNLQNSVKKFTPIPGWNRNVKALYRQSRDDFLRWVKAGRDYNSILFFEMQVSRKVFKTALKECRKNNSGEINKSITEKYKNKNSKEFWEEINNNKSMHKKSSIIDGNSNESEIVKIFSDLYFNLDGDDDIDTENNIINNLLTRMQNDRCMYLITSLQTVRACISNLNDGVGHDNIHSKFLKHSSDEFVQCISLFINACYAHGHFPINMLKGVVNPRLKNKSGNCTDSQNYRPVMQSSNLLKIAETVMLNVLSDKIFLNCRQFGYSRGVSTSEATLVLKETVYKYISKNQNVYALFIDLSKAFDRVNHFKLANILLKKNIPPDLVWILLKFLRNQTAVVKWGNTYGDSVYLELGCRQGGILSAFLFKVYIDSILESLSKVDCGVKYSFCKINVLAYADDLVLLSKSIKGLNYMYQI